MSETIRTYTGDGERVLYPIDFTLGYLRREYVYVYQGDVTTDFLTQVDYTWMNEGEILLAAPVALDSVLYIRRIVPRQVLENDYEDGSILHALNLDNSYRQPLMIIEELQDSFMVPGTIWSLLSDIDANGFTITNLRDGESPQDVATYAQLLEVLGTVEAGLASFIVDKFVDGVDYTAGVTTDLFLSSNPAGKANTWCYFDEVFQSTDKYSTLHDKVTFNDPIPGGVGVVEIKHGTALASTDTANDSGRPLFNFLDEDVVVNGDHIGAYLRIAGTSTSLICLPLNATVALPIGTEIHATAADTIEVSVEEDSFNGQVVRPSAGKTLFIEVGDGLTQNGGTITMKKVDTDTWDVFGGLIPV